MDSLHEIPISAPLAHVFEAWTTGNGLRSWWTSDVTVPEGADEHYVFGFDGGRVKFHFQVDSLSTPETVRWTGVPGTGMPDEWIGTQIDVGLTTAADGGTKMRFAHRNWRSVEGAFCVCNTTWGELMYRLRDYCEGRAPGPLFTGDAARAEDCTLILKFAAPSTELYEAVATEQGLRGWWTRFASVDAQVGGEARFVFPSADFYAFFKIVALIPERLIEFECFDAQHAQDTGFRDPRDWVGTRIRFEVRRNESQSELHFTHTHLRHLECKDVCTRGWEFYLDQSLRALVETGAGKPAIT